MTDLFADTVTIFNDIPATDSTPRIFTKHLIKKCSISRASVEVMDGTIRRIQNRITVITKDVEYYQDPEIYAKSSQNSRTEHFTVKTGDYIVLDICNDTVTNAQEFAELQVKYKDNGFKVVTVNPSIKGMSVDNILMTNT